MNWMKAVIVFTLSLVLAVFAHAAATKKPYVLQVDPQALAVAQASFAAMGGSQAVAAYQDSQLAGTVVIYTEGSSTSYPITVKSKGLYKTRVELQKTNGANVRVVNHGRGAIIHPDGSVKTLWSNNTFYEHVEHVPLLSLLSEYGNGRVNLLYKGAQQIKGQSEDVIELDFVPRLDPDDGPTFASMSRTFFFVNQVTHLVDKTQRSSFTEGSSKETFKEEVYMSDYRMVDGMLVPFHQAVFLDGHLDTDLTFTSVNFNVGISDSEFALPKAR